MHPVSKSNWLTSPSLEHPNKHQEQSLLASCWAKPSLFDVNETGLWVR